MKNDLYVIITSECLDDAKKFSLMEALNTLKQRVEIDQNLNKFEAFDSPYLMRKKFAYQYRLLTKVITQPYQDKNFDLLVFLKIFHRGDKIYNNFYINSRPQFDAIYKQSDAEQQIEHFLQNFSPINHIAQNQLSYDELTLLTKYRTDSLSLTVEAHDYYYESTVWQYAVAPKLSHLQLTNIYHTLFQAMEQAQCGELQLEQGFDIKTILKNKNLPIIYPQKIAFNLQDTPYLLGWENNAYSTNDYTTDIVLTSPYQRKIPLEILFNDSLWCMTQQHRLPLQLNEFQKHCLDVLFFNYQDFPAFIQASANTGKTTLLALLYSHFIFQQSSTAVNQSLPCLFLCQQNETESLRQQLKSYILFQQTWHNLPLAYNAQQLEQLLQQSCLSSRDYLWSALNSEQQKLFPLDYFIDEYRFCQLYNKQFNPEKNAEFDCAQIAWQVIRYIIKEHHLVDDNLDNILHTIQYYPLSTDFFKFIYEKIWKSWYIHLKKNMWDEQDLLNYIDENEINLPYYATLLVDNSQQLSANYFKLLLNHNTWLARNMMEQLSNIPLIFMANQELSHHIYKWQPTLLNILNQFNILNHYEHQTHSHIQPTHISEHTFSTYNAITSLFERYHYGLSLSSRYSEHIAPPKPGNPVEILFIDEQSMAFIPLLQQQHIPIIINNAYQNKESVLNHHSIFQHLCQQSSSQEFNFTQDLMHLPCKSDSVILAGFDLDVIQSASLILQPYDPFKYTEEKFTEKQRYCLDGQLYVLEKALQQGLKRIYLMANRFNFTTWQTFFNHPNIHFRMITTDDISSFNLVHAQHTITISKNFNDYLHQDIQADDVPDILHYIDEYRHNFNLTERLKYEALYYFHTHQVKLYWQKYATYPISSVMFEVLWVKYDMSAFLQYKTHAPSYLNLHLTAIELSQQYEISSQWLKSWQELCHNAIHVAEYINPPNWAATWLKLQQSYLSLLQKNVFITTQQYQFIYDAMQQWIKHNLIYDIDLWAFLNTRIGQYQTAINLWHNAYHTQHQLYPVAYHWAKLHLIPDLTARLDYLFKHFNSQGILQELLNMNLNELQQEYWQQILNYLYEDDELIPILEQLLPAIDSPQVLDRLVNMCKLADESDEFPRRVQRFKTLNACLNSDWDYIIERLEFYIPPNDNEVNLQQRLSKNFQNVSVIRSNRSKAVASYQYNEELIDILYALNLNTNFTIPVTQESYQEYQNNQIINQIFKLIRRNFAIIISTSENDDDITWKANFPAVRALTCLIEKSPDLKDAISLYIQLLSESNSREANYNFFLERLYVSIERAKLFSKDNNMQTVSLQMQERFKKQFHNYKLDELAIEPPILKQTSDIMKGILALTNKENQKIQQLEREERQAIERQEKERKEREKALLREQEEQIAKAKAEQKRIAQENARLEQERIAQENARLEQERIAQENARLEQERIAQENALLEQERIAQENARLEQERIAQENARLEQERIALQHQSPQSNIQAQSSGGSNETIFHTHSNHTPQSVNLSGYAPRSATSELNLFDLRIFVVRTHRRINIEHIHTGELCSIYLNNGQIKTDWLYQQNGHIFHLPMLQLNILLFNDSVHLHQLEQGIYIQIQC